MIMLDDFAVNIRRLGEELVEAGFKSASVLRTNRLHDASGSLVLDADGRPTTGDYFVGVSLVKNEDANEQKVRDIAAAHRALPALNPSELADLDDKARGERFNTPGVSHQERQAIATLGFDRSVQAASDSE